MNELALFAGTGGGILGGKLLGWRTVCAVEIDPYCREVLLRRQEEGHLEAFPVWDDVRTFDGTAWRGAVDIVTAGFPCQPFSVAGKQRGGDDERNMWPETARILGEVRPRVALLENVPGLLCTPYWGTILGDLAEIGFDAPWDCIPASAVGSHFVGDRLWFITTPAATGCMRWKGLRSNPIRAFSRDEFTRLVEHELSVCVPAGKRERVSDGIPCRVDRLRAIGNGQVPAVVAKAWRELTGVS